MIQTWKLDYILVESNQGQLAVVQFALREGLPVVPRHSVRNKQGRATTAEAYMQAGQIYFLEGQRWQFEFESELFNFPKVAHDDQVDALSMAAIELHRTGGAVDEDGEGAVESSGDTTIAERLRRGDSSETRTVVEADVEETEPDLSEDERVRFTPYQADADVEDGDDEWQWIGS